MLGAAAAVLLSPAAWARTWTEGAQAALFAWLAVVLALLAVALWWRQLRAARDCERLRQRLAAEQSQRATTERALLDTHANLCRIAAEQESTRETERRRIGRDLHDDLGQHLLALQLDIGTLGARLRDDPQAPPTARQQIAAIEQHLQLTVRSLRGIVNDLRPAALDQGLRHAVGRQLDEFARLSGIRCHLETAGDDPATSAVRGPPVRLSGRPVTAAFAAAETALFRVLQEALSNVLRHAAASEVHVALCRSAAGFELSVRDNGIGLAPGCERRGHGLTGMADRVAAAGGKLAFDSSPGAGTTVRISVPTAVPGTAESHQAEYCD